MRLTLPTTDIEAAQPIAPAPLGLALSGGGSRAMAFHAGIMDWLAEAGALERVGHVSTVSGGSLLVALMLKQNGWAWPTSADWTGGVRDGVRETLAAKSLTAHAVRQLLRPANWRMVTERAVVLAETLAGQWGIDARLDALPATLNWTINGTTAETGNPMLIRGGTLTDAACGTAAAPKLKLAAAVAMSAAVPGGIGPLALPATAFDWRDADGDPVTPPFPELNVYDGGLYDNLGLEALFDPAAQRFTAAGLETLIVSNAGHPAEAKASKGVAHPERLVRFAELQFATLNDLRARSFRHFVSQGRNRGTYARLGAAFPESQLSVEDLAMVRRYRTQLNRIDVLDFDRIARHGYETIRETAASDGLKLNRRGANKGKRKA